MSSVPRTLALWRSLASAPLAGLLAASIGWVGCSPPPENSAITGEFGAEGVGFAAADYADQVASIDEIVMQPIREGRIAGASIAVIHEGEPVAIRGYGWADLELNVPTPEDAVYEIGSVTKQFTAAALLQLQERGLVDLDAEIVEYLPDFPTQGNRITVRELLDHTSGMRGYTEMPEAYPYFLRRVPADSLIALVGAHPFDFPTGTQMIYNNSAYFLGGMIIEQASGRSYEEYVEETLFAELGMADSYYCSETEIQDRKVNGYDAGEHGLQHKGFLVHSVPFAAGSLCSTARDLGLWLSALHGGEVLTDDAYSQLTTPGDLNDGTQLRYGLGLALTPVAGHRAVHHGGGINGFLSQSLYLPDEALAVVVLINSAAPPGPDSIAEAIVKELVGDRTPQVHAYDGELSAFSGTFEGPARGGARTVRVDAGDVLTITDLAVGGQAVPPGDQTPDTLRFVEGATFSLDNALLTFEVEDGQAQVLRLDAGYGYSVMTRR